MKVDSLLTAEGVLYVSKHCFPQKAGHHNCLQSKQWFMGCVTLGLIEMTLSRGGGGMYTVHVHASSFSPKT